MADEGYIHMNKAFDRSVRITPKDVVDLFAFPLPFGNRELEGRIPSGRLTLMCTYVLGDGST